MPSPIDVLLDPVSLAVFGLYAALMLWEYLAPARPLPASPAWRVRGLLAFAAYFALSTYLPVLWADHLAPLQLFDLQYLPVWAGAAVGVLAYEIVGYAYHRAMHASNWLWRILHQMHHSAERLDTYGAFWFHPLDMVGWTAVTSLALTVVVGLSPAATTAALLVVTFLTIFQHANLRTPRWLGYVVQRPESHSWHHARGHHRDNYADLPLIDILFGTFHNPRDFAPAAGFSDGASLRLGDMLLFRDVAGAPAAPR
ncbi:sterol desaturase family protein [Dokdonella sp.]|uniref:sterol desaturase family protein n=1 Tax=Dokdonella sp. TaxID=2291710 RepID=UPI002F3EAE4D